jgi:uncharacterized protein RhaS with RHS repeats
MTLQSGWAVAGVTGERFSVLDHLGSMRRLTDASGEVKYSAEYDPHGQVLYENPANDYLNSHKFT